MIADANPLYKRLMHGAKPPTVAQMVVLTAILLAVSLLVKAQGPTAMLAVIELVLMIVTLPLVAGGAAQITSRDTQSEAFTLQKLTLLSAASVVNAYTLAGLFRSRVLIGVFVALLPILIAPLNSAAAPLLGTAPMCHVFLSAHQLEQARIGGTHPPCAARSDLRFAVENISNIILYGASVLAIPAAALIGVWRGLASKRPSRAISEGVFMGAMLSFSYIGYLTLLGPAISPGYACIGFSCTMYHLWPNILWYAAIPLGFVVLLTVGMYWLARRAV